MSYKVKGPQFHSGSEHVPRLQARSPAGAWVRGNQWMFLLNINFLSLFLLPFPSL